MLNLQMMEYNVMFSKEKKLLSIINFGKFMINVMDSNPQVLTWQKYVLYNLIFTILLIKSVDFNIIFLLFAQLWKCK